MLSLNNFVGERNQKFILQALKYVMQIKQSFFNPDLPFGFWEVTPINILGFDSAGCCIGCKCWWCGGNDKICCRWACGCCVGGIWRIGPFFLLFKIQKSCIFVFLFFLKSVYVKKAQINIYKLKNWQIKCKAYKQESIAIF